MFFYYYSKNKPYKEKDLSELQSNNIDNKIKEILNSNILDVQSRSNITPNLQINILLFEMKITNTSKIIIHNVLYNIYMQSYITIS